MGSIAVETSDALLKFSWPKTLPLIMQTEASECGLACIAMIAGYHGCQCDLVTLRRSFAISSYGANLKQLIDIASQLELAGRPLKLDLDSLCELQCPCILHWDMKHFVVMKAVSASKIVILDPAVGEKKIALVDVGKHFTGVALELTPTTGFAPVKAKQRLGLTQFWSKVIGLKRSLILIFALSVALQLFGLVTPYYMQTVVDDVVLRADASLLTVLALGFALLLMVETATSAVRQTSLLQFSSRLGIQMSTNVFNHLVRLPMEYFCKRHLGDIVSRFNSTQTIREQFTTGLISALLDGLMASITLVVMFLYNPKLTLIVIAVVCGYVLLRVAFYRPIRQLNEEALVNNAVENSHFMETMRAIQTIKLFQKESDRQADWQNKLAATMNSNIGVERWSIRYSVANRLLFGGENILIIYLAALAVMDNQMSVGMLFAFVSYKNRFTEAVSGLVEKAIDFKIIGLHFERIADIVLTPKDPVLVEETRTVNTAKRLKGNICVRQLYYAYSAADHPVFDNISFDIKAGETLAIIGPSGCGKTTLMKCLMGLITPGIGDINIDGVPINAFPHYRQQIAAVTQDDQLLNGSIVDNIACFDDNPDHKLAVHCALTVGLHEEIMRMTMQYNTLVGDMGSSLSGGQKQRLLLARALYRRPRILFLDEATSHLDAANEATVNRNIQSMKITRVIVAHRLETIRTADRVLGIKHGSIYDLTEKTLRRKP